jgi:uracil-DNA glycosylase family 4
MGLDSLPYRKENTSEHGPYEIDRPTPAQAPRPLPSPAQSPSKTAAKVAPPDPVAARAGLMAPPSVEAFTAPILDVEEKRARLQQLDKNEVSGCTRCRLCQTRTHTVFGEGDPDAKILFIGEGPGENEDLSGRPFVGKAGQLLDKMINAMGLKREQVFIANIVKCRPPNNREPAPDEVATCTPYLERQLEIIRPRVLVTLGRPAVQHMLQTKVAMGKIRGQWQQWRGIKLMPTFHPAYVLRQYTDETRAAVWSDLKQVLVELGMKVPSR